MERNHDRRCVNEVPGSASVLGQSAFPCPPTYCAPLARLLPSFRRPAPAVWRVTVKQPFEAFKARLVAHTEMRPVTTVDWPLVLWCSQKQQGVMADSLVKCRCKSHSFNRFHLASVHRQTISGSEDICNLAYVSLNAPRRFRKNWQRIYDMWLLRLRKEHHHEVSETEKVAARQHKQPAGLCFLDCLSGRREINSTSWLRVCPS